MNSVVLGITLALSLFLITAIKQPSVEQKAIDRINYYTEILLKKRVPYVWGGYWSIFGFDCSGGIATILKLAGIGGYPRTTAFRMWLIWPHKKKIISKVDIWKEARFPNVLFFTYPNKVSPRPFGHVAWYRRNNNPKAMVMAEASSSAGYFKETEIKRGDARDKAIVGLMVLNLTPGL